MKTPKASKIAKKVAKLNKLSAALGALAKKNGRVPHSKAASALGAQMAKTALELNEMGKALQLYLTAHA